MAIPNLAKTSRKDRTLGASRTNQHLQVPTVPIRYIVLTAYTPYFFGRDFWLEAGHGAEPIWRLLDRYFKYETDECCNLSRTLQLTSSLNCR